MRIQVIDVTPKLAHAWLKKNSSNRPMRPSYVRGLAESMKRGEWAVTHQPIAVNGERLLDGQHRLSAVIESGLPSVRMTVAYGVDTKIFDAIDIGQKRTMADIYKEDLHVIHPISFIGRLVYGQRITARELRPVYNKFHSQMREIVSQVTRSTSRFTAAPIKVAALAAILSGENKEYVHNLYKNMCDFRLERLPRVCQSFVKQVSLSTTQARSGQREVPRREELMVRAFTVFQRGNADMERVMVKDSAPRTAQIRALFKATLGIKE